MSRKKYRPFTLAQCSRGGRWSPRREWDLHELVQAFHEDRKGHVIAEGVTYSASGATPWQLRHSTKHANQFDVLHDGKVIARGNARRLPTKWIRSKARTAQATNTTYESLSR